MHTWLVYLHLLGIFGFILAHGASASAALALRHKCSLERVRAPLGLSGSPPISSSLSDYKR